MKKPCQVKMRKNGLMIEEYDYLIRNNTWILVKKPTDRKLVTCKWVFKIKMNTDGSVER